MMHGSESTDKRLSSIAAAVDERRGWDFSRMRTEREAVPWDYLAVARSYLKPTDAVLDIGTGGGAKLLSLASHFATGVGVDPDPGMIRVARENGVDQSNVTFAEMVAEDLAFPEATFDVVLNRHAQLVVPEVVRVLRPGGYFLTQQVGDQNMANIWEEFGPRRDHPGMDARAHHEDGHCAWVDQFTSSGCRIVATGAYNVRYWVQDVPSLIFWLMAIAGGNEVPAGFSIDRDRQTIDRIIDKYSTANGVRTNEHRTLLIAQKEPAPVPSA